MAQDGDTITYNYTGNNDGNDNLVAVEEDVSAVDEMTIDYVDGGSGRNIGGSGTGAGGRAENVVVDLSNNDTIYIWVGKATSDVSLGRYNGASGASNNSGAGSTEIAFVNTNQSDSDDESFIAGAGGGQGSTNAFAQDGGGGARGGDGGGRGNGTPPPQGGLNQNDTPDGVGAVENISEVTDSGTTTVGGGSQPPSDGSTAGEIQISYRVTLSPPDPPSNLSAEAQ